MLPRIPKVPAADRFRAFADTGRRLSELHIGYEDVERYRSPSARPAWGWTRTCTRSMP